MGQSAGVKVKRKPVRKRTPSWWLKQAEPKAFEPKGYRFSDLNSKREMMLVSEGEWNGWLVYRHPDGQWVTLRKATEEDIHKLSQAMVLAHHS